MRLKDLATEQGNPATKNLDQMSALQLVTAMNREDTVVPLAIRQVLPQIARAVEAVARSLAQGGRLIYVGTGTSGRIGALDASECPPTFGTSPNTVQFLIAGGDRALVHATESSEDSAETGQRDMIARSPGERDVVVGIAASGRTPYTIAALKSARNKGAKTIAIACNPGSALAKAAHIRIEINVGPEVLAGSSRLKAGTAQKLVCNMLTTGAMAQLGYVYGNRMVNLHLKNKKLVERGIGIVESLAKVDRKTAESVLERAGMSVPVALVMLLSGVDQKAAKAKLKKASGNIRHAIEG
ncbi:MAG TPA: N-acetylmuramic acid 6-phosphate etherase [Terracidiphilus sp.]|nr:N-acetylmuramic acid 6-phosphate etherase [Terracidiphilus sp.]